LPEPEGTFADDVRRGLTAAQKSLPPSVLYDAEGSRLFEAITEQPEYYLTRAERASDLRPACGRNRRARAA
jgi:uncharacterized SAM-dependent methyltransferase